MQQAAQLDFYYNIAKVVGAIVITLLLLFVLRTILTRRSGGGELLDEGGSYQEVGPGGSHRLAGAPELDALGAPIEVPEVISPEEERIREMEERLHEAQERRRLFEDQVFTLAKSRPEAVAQLIKDWIAQESE